LRPTILSLLALLVLGCSAPEPADTPNDTSTVAEPPSFETTQVAEGVWRFRWIGHNGLFVQTPEGVIVVDPISTEAASTFAEQIRATLGDVPLLAVVYSHRDADHATGAEVIREAFNSDAPIIAHENALAPLAEANDPALPPPTVTYTDRYEFASSRVVQLHHPGPSHSDDQSVVLVPDVGVAFAVDFVAFDRVAYQDLPGWHMPGQIEAVVRLQGLEFETIVFGHGPNGDRAAIARQLEYWEALRDAVADARQRGLSADEAAEEIELSQFAAWDRYDDWFQMNVRGMYRLLGSG
jgi:cyclase